MPQPMMTRRGITKSEICVAEPTATLQAGRQAQERTMARKERGKGSRIYFRVTALAVLPPLPSSNINVTPVSQEAHKEAHLLLLYLPSPHPIDTSRRSFIAKMSAEACSAALPAMGRTMTERKASGMPAATAAPSMDATSAWQLCHDGRERGYISAPACPCPCCHAPLRAQRRASRRLQARTRRS